MGSLLSYIQRVYFKAKTVWYHNEEVFHHDKGRTNVIDANQDLIIVKALPKDNGVWACQVRLDEKSQLFTSVYTIAVENSLPDIKINEGDPFELPCNNGGLARFFESRLSARWYHNTDIIESSNAESSNDHELGVRSSAVTDGGIWKCKVKQLDVAHPKEWVTNVIRVNVVSLKPPNKIPSKSSSAVLHSKSSDVSLSSSDSDEVPGKSNVSGGNNSATVLVVLLVVLVIVCVGVCWCLRKRKRSKGRERDVEKGKRLKKRKKRKFKSPKNIFKKRKDEEETLIKKTRSETPPKRIKSPRNFFKKRRNDKDEEDDEETLIKKTGSETSPKKKSPKPKKKDKKTGDKSSKRKPNDHHLRNVKHV